VSVLRLRRREERRVLAGHDWVFSNEIDTAATPLKGLEPGADVVLESSEGRFLAHGFANPASLIAVRLTGRRRNHPFDDGALMARLRSAQTLREQRYGAPFYRWVYGESDGLPGLVVDRYEDVAVVQVSSAGMERRLDTIVDALVSLGELSAVLLRNDAGPRELEGLPLYRRWAHGEERQTLHVLENGLAFQVPTETSQKTGWFYDHRDSRQALRSWCDGARVLDLYSYAGAFALNAIEGGAREVVAIDSSAPAIASLQANAERQGVAERIDARTDDVVEAMRGLGEADERFEVIVLDPPAFVKRKKDREAGLRHYALNHKLALRLLVPGGILLSASCSQPIDQATLLGTSRKSLPRERERLQVLSPIAQAADHPVHAAMPETAYLTGAITRVV